MRFRLRTLLIFLALAPPVIAAIFLYPVTVVVVVATFGLLLAHVLEIGLVTYVENEKRFQEERRRKKISVNEERPSLR